MLTIAVGIAALLVADAGSTQTNDPKRKMTRGEFMRYVWRTRPYRRDAPLREENISDREVVEIQTLMKERYPGSIVYISAVTTGCPCEDGARCTAQVWSVASRGEISDGIALSHMDGKWQIGPLQEWWIVRDRIRDLYRQARDKPPEERRIDYEEYRRRMREHEDAFPVCAA